MNDGYENEKKSPLVVINGVDLSALSKPMKKLIESISRGVGGAYRPLGTILNAKAEAIANEITIASSIKLNAIEKRAVERIVANETRRQHNIESIASQAATKLEDDVSETPVDDDWLTTFFQFSQDISDEKMQGLWAKLLAGEVRQPGSFQRRTLRIVEQINQHDAELFKKVADACWLINADDIVNQYPIIATPDSSGSKIDISGLSYSDKVHLDSIGLIKFETAAKFSVHPEKCYAKYGSRAFELQSLKSDGSIPIGNVLLTEVGRELLQIVEIDYQIGQVEKTVEFWQANLCDVREMKIS